MNRTEAREAARVLSLNAEAMAKWVSRPPQPPSTTQKLIAKFFEIKIPPKSTFDSLDTLLEEYPSTGGV